jgi:hypothetical protein
VGKPEGKRPLGRSIHRWMNIKLDLIEISWGGIDRIDLAQDRDQWMTFVNMVMDLWIPCNVGKLFFSRWAQLHEVRWLSCTLGDAF